MLAENRARIESGLPINRKYVESRLSMLYRYIPRCWDAEQVKELKDEQRLLRKYRRELKNERKRTMPPS